MNLEIIITTEQEEDYDGVVETTKVLTASIDGFTLKEEAVFEDSVSDIDATIQYKAMLSEYGYTWDN